MNFYSTERLKYEINQHKDKIQTLGDYSDSELNRLIYITTKKIKFINVNLIPIKIYKIANKLTNDIDLDDSEFIALTDHIKGNLWSGDKKLIKGLKLKNWTNVISTNELYRLL